MKISELFSVFPSLVVFAHMFDVLAEKTVGFIPQERKIVAKLSIIWHHRACFNQGSAEEYDNKPQTK